MTQRQTRLGSAARCVVVATVVCLSSSLAAPASHTVGGPRAQTQQRYRSMSTNDQGLRKLAVHAPVPRYPAPSLAGNVSGVAVATVSIDVAGTPESVRVLEAPDDLIGTAVREAVQQWRFKSFGVPIRGELIFYFHIASEQGVVSSPEEMRKAKAPPSPAAQPDSEKPALEIDEARWPGIRTKLSPTVLDIRERPSYLRAHRDGAVNIPLTEVLTRAGAELSVAKPVVIDCFPAEFTSGACRMAAHQLASEGFETLVLKR